MASYNKVLLMGNLTRDVEIRQLPSGSSIANIGLAVNEKYKDKNDQWVERTNFIDCEAWGRKGEVIAQYLTKGSPIFIEGKLRLDTWQDKNDGSNRSKLKVVVENFDFVEPKGGGGGGSGGGGDEGYSRPTVRTVGGGGSRQAEPAGAQGGYEEINEGDIPF